MNLRKSLIGMAAAILFAGMANAATMRVIFVQSTDVGAYLKALEDGKVLLKQKGSAAQLHVWFARYAGSDAGSVMVTVEYPSLDALAKDDGLMRSDPELRAWLERVSKLRKIVSDSIYEEMKP